MLPGHGTEHLPQRFGSCKFSELKQCACLWDTNTFVRGPERPRIMPQSHHGQRNLATFIISMSQKHEFNPNCSQWRNILQH